MILCAAIASAAVFAQSTAGSRSAVRADPLQGTWETKSVSTRVLRQVLVSSGSTDAQVASFFKFFGMGKAWRNRLNARLGNVVKPALTIPSESRSALKLAEIDWYRKI